MNLVDKVKGNPKWLLMGAAVLLIVIYFVNGFKNYREVQEYEQQQQELENISTSTDSYLNYDSDSKEYADLYDQEIIKKQDNLIKKYGSLPDGYLWDLDGTLLSLGDKDKTAEEAVYAYINGIRTLDFSSAQKYSRGSRVVERYQSFFNSSESKDDSYADNFYRNMYTEVLTSIQIKDIKSTAVFAENKQVFTIELEMLDLSSKDFWEEDKNDIYNTLYIYSRDEDDSSKSEQYVYNYVLDYYRSDEAVTKNVTVNLTVEKYARLDTGWLVTIDTDIDNYCYYTDGNVVAKYILNSFNNEGKEYIKELRQSNSN